MTRINLRHRRQGRFTKGERQVVAAAEEILLPEGYELTWGYGSKHPDIFAEKGGRTYFLPASNSPSHPDLDAKEMRKKCAKLLAGAWNPQ